ncbi:MAG: hypothetical protein WCD47_22430 [Candidatus Sulfotelmatobacter sp.]
MSTKRRSSFVVFPIAKFFRPFSGEGVFQQPRDLSTSTASSWLIKVSTSVQSTEPLGDFEISKEGSVGLPKGGNVEFVMFEDMDGLAGCGKTLCKGGLGGDLSFLLPLSR